MKKYLLIISALLLFTHVPRAGAATNISATSTEHWAWNDIVGWMDFYNTDSITVSQTKLTGYASSSVGDVSLDCQTTRIGNICGSSNYGVTNDGAGNLSGWGWNDVYGWISFDCNNTSGCGTSNYRVYIDSGGNFNNYAWNDVIGWISFSCANSGTCGTSNYKVTGTWVPTSTSGFVDSATFDTQALKGAQLNSVLWSGSQPGGTAVRFQFAVSNASSGPWSYMGTDGTANTYWSTGPGVSLPLSYTLFNNFRYFRYRVILFSNLSQTLTPRVDDIYVNWSP